MIDDPVLSVSESGITAPTFGDILEFLRTRAQQIFGQDIVLSDDSQDGQLLALIALAISNVNSQAIAVYNAYNPQTAVGVALDGAVKVNGISRRVATHSTVDLRIVGQAGTIITEGYAFDTFDQRWNLPATVTIPISGEITVTATADEAGAVQAAANSITIVGSPTFGWQTVNNPLAATPGVAVETDAELRQQQSVSTAQPSMSLWEGIASSVLALDGVTNVSGKKNDTDTTDSDGIPGHSIALVVEGGDADEIGATIYLKKGEGTGTYGTTSVVYTDTYGFPNTVNFSRPTQAAIGAEITITPTATYTTLAEDDIKARIAEYVESLKIGDSVDIMRVMASAIKDTETGIDTRFDVDSLLLSKNGGASAASSVTLTWREVATCDVADITVTVNNV